MRKPTPEEIELLNRHCCSALNDRTRIAILYELGEGPKNVTCLVDALGIPQATVSRHLTVLRERSFVVATRDGNRVVYELEDDRVLEILNSMRRILATKLRHQEETAGRIRSAQRATKRKRGTRPR